MEEILIPDGDKIKKARGTRSRREIAAASGGQFTEQALLFWENKKFTPKPEHWFPLASALGVSLVEISTPLSTGAQT